MRNSINISLRNYFILLFIFIYKEGLCQVYNVSFSGVYYEKKVNATCTSCPACFDGVSFYYSYSISSPQFYTSPGYTNYSFNVICDECIPSNIQTFCLGSPTTCYIEDSHPGVLTPMEPFSTNFKIKYTPNQASAPVIMSPVKPAYCPGDIITVTSTDLYPGKTKQYTFKSYYNGSTVAGETFSTTGTPVWVYTVPAFNTSKTSVKFTAQISGVANSNDSSPWSGPESVASNPVFFSQAPPSVKYSVIPPICKGEKTANLILTINGSNLNNIISFTDTVTGTAISSTLTSYTIGISVPSLNHNIAFMNTLTGNVLVNGVYTINGYSTTTSNVRQLFEGLSATGYLFQLRNYYSYGGNQCYTELGFNITDPYTYFSVSGTALNKSNSAYQASCSPNGDGIILATASGGNNTSYTYSVLGITGLYANNTLSGLSGSSGSGISYTFRAKDSKGCFSTPSSSIILKSPPPLVIPNPIKFSIYNSYDISCYGGNNGKIQLSVTGGGGIGGYNFTMAGISGTTSITGLSVNTATFTGFSAGAYTGYARDGLGCSATLTGISLTSPTQLSITGFTRPTTYNGYDVSCSYANDGYLNVLAGGGISNTYSYAGSNLVFSSSNSFSGLSPGTLLTYYVKDANSCTTSAGITLTVPSALSMTGINQSMYNGYNISCYTSSGVNNNGIVTLTGAGGISAIKTYSFSITGYTSKSAFVSTVFSGLSTGNYNYILKDDNACVLTGNFNMTQPPRLRLLSYAPLQPTCYGKSNGSVNTRAQGGIAGIYNYTLSGSGYKSTLSGTNTVNFITLSATGYQLHITDVNNCGFDSSFAFTQPGLLQINSLTGYVVCKEDLQGKMMAEVTGGTLPYTYVWATTSVSGSLNSSNTLTGTSATITGLSKSTAYSLHFTDVNQCGDGKGNSYVVKTAVLAEPASGIQFKPTGLIQPLCFGNVNGSVLLSVTGGWGGYQYSSNNGVSYANITSFPGLSTGNYRYFTKDANGCIKDTTFFVPQPNALGLSGRSIDVTCYSSKNGIIMLTATGGTMPYAYKMTGVASSTITGSLPAIAFNGLDIGSYSTSLIDKNNCSVVGSGFNIIQPAILQLTIDKTDAACQSATGSAFSTVTGGTFPYQYDWSSGNATTTSIAHIKSGTYLLKVTDAQLCTVSGNTSVSDTDGPIVKGRLEASTRCAETSDGVASIWVDSTAKPIVGYEWLGGDPDIFIGSTSTIAGSLAAFQTVTGIAIDTEGCQGSALIYIDGPDPILLTLTGTNPVCHDNTNGQIASFTEGGTPPYIYLWNDSLRQSSSDAANLKGYSSNLVQTKDYRLFITDNKLCTAVGVAMLTNPSKIVVDLGKDTVIVCEGQKVSQDAQNPSLNHYWQSDNGFSSNSQTISSNKAGLYVVTVTDAKGCFATDKFRLITSKSLLQASFASVDTIYAGDTVRLSEISWPVPDSVKWTFPNGIRLLNNDSIHVSEKDKEYIYLIADSAGSYALEIEAHLADCASDVTKKIEVKPRSGKTIKDSRWGYKGIKTYKAYPNPTADGFHLYVELTEVFPLQVQIYNALSTPVYTLEVANQLIYDQDIDLAGLPEGIYAITLNTPGNQKIIRIVKL